EAVGWDKVVEVAQKCGIESKLQSVPSVGLGSNDVSVFEMVKADGTFMNKGMRTDPSLVSHIVNMDGEEMARFQATLQQVISPANAWLMTYMLRGTVDEPGGTPQADWGMGFIQRRKSSRRQNRDFVGLCRWLVYGDHKRFGCGCVGRL